MKYNIFAVFALVFFSATLIYGAPGDLRWSYATGGDVGSSPAIGTDGTIYVGSEDSNLHAINPDGTYKWSYTTGGSITSSPAI